MTDVKSSNIYNGIPYAANRKSTLDIFPIVLFAVRTECVVITPAPWAVLYPLQMLFNQKVAVVRGNFEETPTEKVKNGIKY